MKAHKVDTRPRNGGYLAACRDCDAITFGGFPTRTAARDALAGHEHEEAPGAVGAAAEGSHPGTMCKGNETNMTTIPDPRDLRQPLDLTEYTVEIHGPRVAALPSWEMQADDLEWFKRTATVIVYPITRRLILEVATSDELATAAHSLRRIQSAPFSIVDKTIHTDEHGDSFYLRTYGRVAAAEKCETPGCYAEGTYPEPADDTGNLNHLCRTTSDAQEAAEIDVYFDDEFNRWQVDFLTRERVTPADLRAYAQLLTEAADQVDELNGVTA